MAAISLNAETRVRTLIALTEELTCILAFENKTLGGARECELTPLREDKTRVVAAYKKSIRDIAENRNIVQGVKRELLEKLLMLTREFEAHACEQRAILDAVTAPA